MQLEAVSSKKMEYDVFILPDLLDNEDFLNHKYNCIGPWFEDPDFTL